MAVSRLTPAAKSVMARGYQYASRDRAGEIREEHLLEALVADTDGRRLLGDRAFGEDMLRQIRAELADSRRKAGLTAAEESALAGLGIDVEAVVHHIEDQFGARAMAAGASKRPRWWHKPVFGPEAVRVLAEAERHLSAAGGRSLGVEHLSLALVSAPSAIGESLVRRGVSESTVREALAAQVGSRLR